MGLANSQYSKIMRVYGERQLKSYRELSERQERAYRRAPRLQELDRAVGEESVRAAEAMLAGDRTKKRELRRRISEIGEERKRVLLENGFPEDMLELQYICLDCRDTGFIRGKKCHCFLSLQRRLLYRQSNVEEIVGRENFRHFDLSVFDDREPIPEANGRTSREYMGSVLRFSRDWCRKFREERGNLILMGKTGTGKTFLMNCITKEILDQGFSVIYLSSTDLFESLSYRRKEENEEEQGQGEAALEADLLLIDDLGTELSNSFTASKLFYVINQRMVMKRSTILSTNLNFGAIRDTYSDRVVSRLMSEDYDIIPLYGRDQRIPS